MVIFYCEFDNGDSNCYQGERIPTLEEANIFCQHHIQNNKDWNEVVYVGTVSYEQAAGLWDLSVFWDKERDWPVFKSKGEQYVQNR
jgi:hypothetical protein